MTEPRKLQFNVKGYTGLDNILSFFYPAKAMAKRIAKKITREGGPFYGIDPTGSETHVVIVMPDRPYRIIDKNGNVAPYEEPVSRIGV